MKETLANIKKNEAMSRVLIALQGGATIADAMKSVNRHRELFYVWRVQNPLFARDAVAALAQGKRGSNREADFVKFRRIYLGYETYTHQQMIVDAIEKAPEGGVVLVLLPPEGGKTTLVEDWMTQKIATYPNTRIGVVCATKEIAGKRIGRIAKRLETPEKYPSLHKEFGPFKVPGRNISKPWNKERLTVEKADHDERDPTLEAKGAGTVLYGARWDYIVLDDYQTIQSLNKTGFLLSFFRQEIISRVAKSGKIIIVGTRVGPGDVYEKLLTEDLIDIYVRIPAVDPFGRSYWPAVFDVNGERVRLPNGDPLGWSIEELEKRKKQVGTEAWTRTYMQEAASKATATFPQEVVEKSLRRDIASNSSFPRHGILASVDPALARFAGFCVVAYSADQMIVVDGASVGQLATFEGIWDKMEEFTKKWQPSEWMVEANHVQRGLARDDRLLALKAKHGFRIIEHTTGNNKADDRIGVASMAGSFLRGEIQIAYGDPYLEQAMKQLIDELVNWRYDTPTKALRQDFLMALWFCYLRWQSIRKLLGHADDGFKRPGLTNFTPNDIYRRSPVGISSQNFRR